ncbi:glycogen debranching enzyme [Opitutaceae bacterium TAV1]|nr:glycogen debranching enzyme [Opitutaceae bacterium TAV1]
MSYCPFQPTRLRVNSFKNPLGFTEQHPVLTWELPNACDCDSIPVAWRIRVATTSEQLISSEAWDSGWVTSAINEAPYAGPALHSRERSYWTVRVRCEDGAISDWAEPAFWETGLLSSDDWSAKWIQSGITGGKRTCAPAPYLRAGFSLSQKPAKARLYITALGLYDCEINGRPVTDDVFLPGWTDYAKRVQVQTYDVTTFLQTGENAIGAILGDGWYCGFVNHADRQFHGPRPALLAQLEIEFTDGSVQRIVSDETWKYSTGPILENDLLMGESYDARLELGAWSSPGYDESGWRPVSIFPPPPLVLQSSASPRVRRQEVLAVQQPLRASQDYRGWKTRIYDLGQNIAGRVRIAVRGRSGSYFQLRHAEMLDAQGNVYTENLRTARSIDSYVCRGNDVETWEPRFTFHGFRYVEVASSDPDAGVIEIEGIALYSDMEATGEFACSNPLLNQLFKNIHWGMKGNFLEVPTDCPQRDERQGWTGDAQVFIPTACFLRDVRGFFEKWALDLADAQGPSGEITAWAPRVNTSHDSGPAWSDAVIICPWEIYRHYGDRRILEQNYPTMRRFLGFLKKHRCKDGIRSHPDIDPWGGHGDWLALDGSSNWEGTTPKDLIGTAFLAHDLDLMARIARVLGKPEDAAACEQWRRETVQAFQRRFVTGDGLLVGKTQTAYVLALHFKLLPETLRPAAARELVRDIEKRGWHLSTGFVGTPHLCQVLEDHGYLDVACRLLEQESFPSWLFPVKNGATTIWERWDGWTPGKGFQDAAMNSFNHYAYGAVGAWMVRTIAGLALDECHPGGTRILLRPRPCGSLTHAEAEWRSPRGRVKIRWEVMPVIGSGGQHFPPVQLAFSIPACSTATLSSPDGYCTEVTKFGPGDHNVTLIPVASMMTSRESALSEEIGEPCIL